MYTYPIASTIIGATACGLSLFSLVWVLLKLKVLSHGSPRDKVVQYYIPLAIIQAIVAILMTIRLIGYPIECEPVGTVFSIAINTFGTYFMVRAAQMHWGQHKQGELEASNAQWVTEIDNKAY